MATNPTRLAVAKFLDAQGSYTLCTGTASRSVPCLVEAHFATGLMQISQKDVQVLNVLGRGASSVVTSFRLDAVSGV